MGQSPFAKSTSAVNSPINRRRSTRVEFAVPIAISGRDATGQTFREETETIMVSAHGANFRARTQILIGMQLKVENLLEGIAEKAICIRVTPPERAEELQLVAIQLVVPRNVWGMSDPPADWLPAITADSPPPPPQVIQLASVNAGPPADASRMAGQEPRVAEITEAALQDLRRQTAVIMQDALREFESCLKTLEAAAETRMTLRADDTMCDAGKSLDHLLREFLEQLTERSTQVAASSEENLRRRIAEFFSPLLRSTSMGNPEIHADPDAKK